MVGVFALRVWCCVQYAAPASALARVAMSSAKALPRDAKLVSLLLATAGAEDAEPGVVAMLLEFAHRSSRAAVDCSETGAGWTSEVLQDSLVYREHAAGKNASAGTGAPTLDDVRLAIQAKVEYTASSTLSKEVRFAQALEICARPAQCGLSLA